MNGPEAPARSKRTRQVVGLGLGLVLLCLAVGFAVRGVEWEVVRQTPAWGVAALAGLVGANLLLTAGLFGSVTRVFNPRPAVKFGTMSALIAVSGLLNFIPFVRAGLWGRAAYLKAYHGLSIRDSVLVLGVVFGLAVAVLGTVCLVLALLPEGVRWWACGGALGVQVVMGPWVWKRALRRPTGGAWMWVVWRTLDLFAAAGRLWLAFGVVGVELSWTDAVLLASANLVVKLVGLTPNGLGVSEWVVAGLSAAMMPIEAATAAGAALVDRAVEVGAMLIAGGAGAMWLKREVGRKGVGSSAEGQAG